MTDGAEPSTGMLLAKIRSSDRLLGASGRRGVEPMRVGGPDDAGPFALDGRPEWFMVEADQDATAWDQAHAQVAAKLGIADDDVLFVEPDRVHDLNRIADGDDGATGVLGLDSCPDQIPQDDDNGKATGDGFAWHLNASHSQLRQARDAVEFAGPRTRVAHIDTGFWPKHQTTPIHINERRQWNFVGRDGRPTSATDPDNRLLIMDNSGHGTGTLSILAGDRVGDRGILGGAPGADIVPLRIADTVMLLRTSALAMAIRYAAFNECAVASLSMGGWPSQAWADAVDEAYEKGLCLVAAGGNRFRPGPPRSLVYPARYPRVIAVTGAMADGSPYDDLDLGTMQGSFGPDSAMESAIAAYTPNIPWAAYGCAELTRLNGEGTSAATPQVAAAAALWIEHNKDVLPSDWKRVEAVRHALFSTAKSKSRADFYGNGILQANDALDVAPIRARKRTKRSTHRWAVWRMLTGLGIDGESAREQMFNLELAQLWMTNERLAELIPDPESATELTPEEYEAVVEVLLDPEEDDEMASTALRRHLDERVGQLLPRRVLIPDFTETDDIEPVPELEPTGEQPGAVVPAPSHRRLRVYAKDPTLATSLATSPIGEVTLRVPWEQVEATPTGFRGRYVEVLEDEPEGRPLDRGVTMVDGDGRPLAKPGLLDDPNLLGQDGWPPSPSNLHFHQQMVYAVTNRTIEHFERALGRPVQWRSSTPGGFQRRLVVRPHALDAANAFYSPGRTALLFGSFKPKADDDRTPNMAVHTCLSYDIIAHETTHAVLDGMYGSFTEPTNPDVLAFHEAFSDLVALLQSFDLTELLEHQIRGSRGDLKAETLLGKLAVQFGEAVRGREALRSAIGTVVDGTWVRTAPDPTLLTKRTTPHARGAILVSAVFDALIGIYEGRTADLFRIASGGTGVVRDGAIDPDLTRRLASEAAKSARHLLRMCIRALDYVPPVDITFFDFLRALVTADYEFVRDDQYNYRLAVIEAFTKRGIGPGDSDASDAGGTKPKSLSDDALRWRPFQRASEAGAERHYEKIVIGLRKYAEDCTYAGTREQLHEVTERHREDVKKRLVEACQDSPPFRRRLGLDEGPFEVDGLRRAMRARPNGRVDPEVIVSLTQERPATADDPAGTGSRLGGVTIIINVNDDAKIPRYLVVKGMADDDRVDAMDRFAVANAADPLRALYLAPADRKDRFAALHLPVDDV